MLDVLGKLSYCMEESINTLQGDFVLKRNSYEQDIVSRFVGDWSVVNNRYYDCVHNSTTYVELKKGQSGMWFDMVRYAEIELEQGMKNTWTMFLWYDKMRKLVKEIYIFPTSALMNALNMSKELAMTCIAVNQCAPRGCNVQYSITKKDLRNIAQEHGAVVLLKGT